MKKILLLNFLIVLFFQNVYPQTYIGGHNPVTGEFIGNIFYGDSVWTEEGSPYILLSNLIIDDNAVLSIKENVTVIGRSRNINVKGSIDIDGTENQLVTIDSSTILNFENNISTSEIDFANFNNSSIFINTSIKGDSLLPLKISDTFF